MFRGCRSRRNVDLTATRIPRSASGLPGSRVAPAEQQYMRSTRSPLDRRNSFLQCHFDSGVVAVAWNSTSRDLRLLVGQIVRGEWFLCESNGGKVSARESRVTVIVILPSLIAPFVISDQGFPVNRNEAIALAALGGFAALWLLRHRDHFTLDSWRLRVDIRSRDHEPS